MNKQIVDLDCLKALVQDIETGKVALKSFDATTEIKFQDEPRYQTGTPHLLPLSRRPWEKAHSFVIVTTGMGNE